MRYSCHALLFLALLAIPAGAQPEEDGPIQTRLFGALQTLVDKGRIDSGTGYGAGAEISTRIQPNVRLRLSLHYDVARLEQPDVLDEWNWDYWQTTYIPFLPGASLAQINHDLVYNSSDSIYSAVFEPSQRMNELRIALGLTWEVPLGSGVTPYIGLNGGLDLYRRGLQMEEHWIKRFDLDSSRAGLDYDYAVDVLHFAPPKKGKRLFAMPVIGLRYAVSSSVDLDGALHYLFYPSRSTIAGLEKMFNISSDSEQWFPFKSKAMMTLGLTFKY